MIETIDEYIAGYPAEIQARMRKIRAAIRRAAPRAEEKISYRIPAFVQDGHLIFFAAFRDHIGVYPLTAGMAKLRELKPFRGKGAKRSMRLAHDVPLPLGLLGRMVRIRVRENRAQAAARQAAARQAKARTRKARRPDA